MNKIATICVRGGSKGIQGKNQKDLHGIPLLAHTLVQIIDSNSFDHIAVSSDDKNLLKIASEYGCTNLIRRPENLATDNSPKIPVIRHCVKEVEKKYNTKFDICVDFDATSPLRNIEDIHSVLSMCIDDSVSNVITGMKARRSPYFNMVELDENNTPYLSKKPNDQVIRRQDSPKCFDMNASIYAWKRKYLFNNDSLFLKKTKFYEMPEDRSIDIDSEVDFKLVSLIMSQKR